jgi:predicted regulator of Ras-like GTPase activity (Roadblock/LC7/MglB family)
VAGGLADGGGADVSVIAAAALAGVSGEATRTADYLNLGEWRNIMAEAETANLVVAPVGAGALLLVRRDQSMAVGLALRFAERARGTALAWLEGQGA